MVSVCFHWVGTEPLPPARARSSALPLAAGSRWAFGRGWRAPLLVSLLCPAHRFSHPGSTGALSGPVGWEHEGTHPGFGGFSLSQAGCSDSRVVTSGCAQGVASCGRDFDLPAVLCVWKEPQGGERRPAAAPDRHSSVWGPTGQRFPAPSFAVCFTHVGESKTHEILDK